MIAFLFQVLGAIVFVWYISIWIYQLLTGVNSETATKTMKGLFKEWLSKEEKSFYVATDEIFRLELNELLKNYSSLACHRTKWKTGQIAGLPYIAFQVICRENDKAELTLLIQELIQDCLIMNGYSQSDILVNWTTNEGIPWVYLRYASTQKEHLLLAQILQQNRLKSVPQPVTDNELEKEIEIDEGRI